MGEDIPPSGLTENFAGEGGALVLLRETGQAMILTIWPFDASGNAKIIFHIYWKLINDTACVCTESVKFEKMLQQQWLQLKITFSLGNYIKIVI